LPREVEVICADWRVLLDREFVFVDGGGEATKTDPDVMRLLGDRRGRAKPGPASPSRSSASPSPRQDGGIALLDDLTPGRPGADPVRELWLLHPELAAVEILKAPSSAAIVAVRR
jgi:hypothetical protein